MQRRQTSIVHKAKRVRRDTGYSSMTQTLPLTAYRERARLEWLQQNLGVPVTIEFTEDGDDARNLIKQTLGVTDAAHPSAAPIAAGGFNEIYAPLNNSEHVVRLNRRAYNSTANFFDELVMYGQLNKLTPKLTARLVNVCIVRTFMGLFVGTTLERLEMCDSMFSCGAYVDPHNPADTRTDVLVSRFIYDMLGLAARTIKANIFHGDLHFGNIAMTPTNLMLIDFDSRSCFVGAPARNRGCSPMSMMGDNRNNPTYDTLEFLLANFSLVTKSRERAQSALAMAKVMMMISIVIHQDQLELGNECPQFVVDTRIAEIMMSDAYKRLAPATSLVTDGANPDTRMSATDVVMLREIAQKMNMSIQALCDGSEVRPCYEQSLVYMFAATALFEFFFNFWTQIEQAGAIEFSLVVEVLLGAVDYGVLALLAWCMNPVQTQRPTYAQLDRALAMLRDKNEMLQWRDPSLLSRLKSLVAVPAPSEIQRKAYRLDFCA